MTRPRHPLTDDGRPRWQRQLIGGLYVVAVLSGIAAASYGLFLLLESW